MIPESNPQPKLFNNRALFEAADIRDCVKHLSSLDLERRINIKPQGASLLGRVI
jgi:hypothetical protein